MGRMEDVEMSDGFGVGFLAGLFLGVMAIGGLLECTGGGRFYKEGQIDALTGIVKYELVWNPDSTREWKAKDGPEAK